MKLSVVIPAHNEEGCVAETVKLTADTLEREHIPYELVVVNDGSTDRTAERLAETSKSIPALRVVYNDGPHGFGFAVRRGLDAASGEAIAVMMADASDSPEDLVSYYRCLEEGYECAFGSRFIRGSRIIDYPPHKLLLNRLANWFVKAIFGLRYNDVTNAFKMYRREVVEHMRPLISPHFNLTVEMPLKAIVRGFNYTVIPISWTNRKTGVSKLKIKEMGSRYLFIVLYLLLEKYLSRGDYRRKAPPLKTPPESAHIRNA